MSLTHLQYSVHCTMTVSGMSDDPYLRFVLPAGVGASPIPIPGSALCDFCASCQGSVSRYITRSQAPSAICALRPLSSATSTATATATLQQCDIVARAPDTSRAGARNMVDGRARHESCQCRSVRALRNTVGRRRIIIIMLTATAAETRPYLRMVSGPVLRLGR